MKHLSVKTSGNQLSSLYVHMRRQLEVNSFNKVNMAILNKIAKLIYLWYLPTIECYISHLLKNLKSRSSADPCF